MKIIFFGTGKFAIPSLKRLIGSGHEVIAVVTQPDRKKGRGYNTIPSVVKAYAEKAVPGTCVLQPENAADASFINSLKTLAADLFVVVDYGQKLSDELLALPRKYCINLHPSLLPEYRGASPINKAILDGKAVTGNTVFKMEEKMDAGKIICQENIKIMPSENAVDLANKMALAGAGLLLQTVDLIAEGKEDLRIQEETSATYAHKISKKDGRIDWNNTAVNILNQIRAFQPWPGAYTYLNGKVLKILEAVIAGDHGNKSSPGQVVNIERFSVRTGKGILEIKEVQIEGKKAMPAADFIRGSRLYEGIFLD